MTEFAIELAGLVEAKRGRDRGRYFAVVGITDGFVMLADGDTRKIANPKLKNVKHVRATGIVMKEVAERYELMTDTELNRIIREYAGRIACQKKM